jgi:diguanylate cyclase
MDVSILTLDRKIWISTIGLIAVTELAIYLHFHSWKEPLFLYLLTLALLIPTWVACRNIKRLVEKDESWKSHSTDLEKQMNQLKEQTMKYRYRETEFKNIFDKINAFVFSLDVPNTKWFIPNRFQESSEMETQDLRKGMEIVEDRIHDEDRKLFLQKKKDWISGIPTTVEFRTVLKDGQIRWNELRTDSIINASGKVEKVFGIIMDVTDRKEKEEKLAQMAYYDTLTELPNRTMLKSHLKKVLARANRKEHEVTIMFMDLDGFKGVNDSLGHDVGDALLKEVANRLSESVREEDLISRLGGDEFILVFEETNQKEITIIADRILKNISEAYLPL